jgi:hypothetical protein
MSRWWAGSAGWEVGCLQSARRLGWLARGCPIAGCASGRLQPSVNGEPTTASARQCCSDCTRLPATRDMHGQETETDMEQSRHPPMMRSTPAAAGCAASSVSWSNPMWVRAASGQSMAGQGVEKPHRASNLRPHAELAGRFER